MDKRAEIANRWLRVFEQRTPQAQKLVFERIKDYIIDDVYFLLKTLNEKEKDLAQQLVGASSKYGQLIVSEEGVLKYRINGKFVDIKLITDGLRELVKLCNMDSLEKRVKKHLNLSELREIFKEEVSDKKQ